MHYIFQHYNATTKISVKKQNNTNKSKYQKTLFSTTRLLLFRVQFTFYYCTQLTHTHTHYV